MSRFDNISEYNQNPYIKPNRDQVNKILNKYNSGISNINFDSVIFTNRGEVLGDATLIHKADMINITEQNWYKKLSDRPSYILWQKDEVLDNIFTTAGQDFIYLIRELQDRETWTKTGILVLGLSENELRKLYSGYVNDYSSIFILDSRSNLISAIDNLNLNELPGFVYNNMHNYTGSNIVEKVNGQELLMNHYTIKTSNWKIFLLNDQNYLLSKFDSIKFLYLMVIVVYFVITLILCSLFLSKFTKPIQVLYQHMEKVKANNLDVNVPVLSRDEIGYLSEQFNSMIGRIRQLMENLVNEQEAKRQAELISLQTQINPHFLYNTLASIRYLIYTEKKEDVDNIILSLIRILRYSLSDTKEFISIQKEISILEDYIFIQKFTFSNTVKVEIDIDEEILNCKTIKLILQPLVENSFMHGLKPKNENGYLSIKGYARENNIYFEIFDNGVGIDLDAGINKTNRTGIGLHNVKDRIKLTFGDEYGLKIESEPGSFTKITVNIPKIEEEFIYNEYSHS
ncbi:two-component system sensor histidine kinase YesM [Herbinix hemicellulosilytica]|uniref:histidine kinase n=1 Tax=Herbinix hemicellulosilytica TaxID=1564487 RepID=A0A0H5SUS6_HERHM|nr:histidine kinase [Herbinix hemicellulosilytica]RBP56473.1 two-component system sensor histidine kinase YesM [Herbinix hemicellulosilytica]CRZ34053.1 hypothetical protein HHT355_0850 [Herbinix hemicellulosilytica]